VRKGLACGSVQVSTGQAWPTRDCADSATPGTGTVENGLSESVNDSPPHMSGITVAGSWWAVSVEALIRWSLKWRRYWGRRLRPEVR
jgi:hypothetical protein